jgi:hypothetical protein
MVACKYNCIEGIRVYIYKQNKPVAYTYVLLQNDRTQWKADDRGLTMQHRRVHLICLTQKNPR